jgi:hypothetical protein
MLGDRFLSFTEQAGGRDVEDDAHRLARAYQDGVLPHEVRLWDVIASDDEEAAGAVDVEGVVHRVVAVHGVDESHLHPVADTERPVDGVIGLGVLVDQLPDHVGGVGLGALPT